MHHPKSKVYFDGSYYIAIPHTEQPWKRRKSKVGKDKNEEKAKKILESKINKDKSEKIRETVEEIDKEIKDIEKSKEIVKKVLNKEKRNRIVRLTRLYRKVNLQQWTHFCTFTYDSEKLNEEEFEKKLLNCLRHLSSRKGWKYIGVWERSPINQRLHFHGIFDILESDVVCTVGQENRKLLLFDDFLCIDEGVVMGKVSPEVISEMPRSN